MYLRLFICKLVVLSVVLLSFPLSSYSSEVLAGKAYSDEELAKLREWEKTWVGKKIDKENFDQVAEFIPETYHTIYKDPESWGAPQGTNFWFEIVPYKTVEPTDGFKAATEKYSSMVKVNDDGSIANLGEIAGRPFPQPETGLEMAYNFDMNNRGDTFYYRKYSPNVNPKSRTERLADQEYWELYFVNRTELDPKPAYSKDVNKRGYRRGYFLHMYLPSEFLNTRMYNLRFIDPSKEDDTYLWYSQFRRIRKLSTKQRTDAIDGTDLIYDDEYCWDGQIMRNKYTYKGKKELLCARHQDMTKISRERGMVPFNGLTLERLNTLVVHADNIDPNYLYGTRIWYLDPESYLIQWTEIYDQQGKIWKCFMQQTRMIETEIGQMNQGIVGTIFVDVQRIHGGNTSQEYYEEEALKPKMSLPVSPDMFTIANLQRTN